MKQLAAALLLCAVVGCSVNKGTINTYADQSLQPGTISSVAVFPIKNARLAPSEARQINRKIATAISQARPEINIVSDAEAVEMLNRQGLADDWAVFLDRYVSSGVPDSGELRRIGLALGVDSILQGEMVNIVQQDGAFGINKAQTRITVRYSLLGTKDGKVLWEASADGIRGSASTVAEAPPVIEAVNLAVDKVVDNLPAL
jgi:hypothetical protein